MDKQPIVGDLCHDLLFKSIKPKLSFDENNDYLLWKKQIKDKLVELLGTALIEANACPLKLNVEEDIDMEGYKRIRFTFESEKGAVVPCYLLIPNTGKDKYPVAITLQGHSSGFHNSIGVFKSDDDKEYIQLRGGDFAIQAVSYGYAALCIEQRCMGERVTSRHTFEKHMCSYAALSALMIGRTTIGERVWDVSRAIDLLYNFPQLDTDKILITGNSGGGTTSFYAACLDERIKICAPSCAFCSYEKSIMLKRHCACNYIPNVYFWFEMQDLACLIAPRYFLVHAGIEDPIFTIEGVREAMDTVRKIYKIENAEDRQKLVETDSGHLWRKDIVWNTINNVTKNLGWI